jgi:hypothetical protein
MFKYYSKPSLIGINEERDGPKRQKKKQINGKFNNIGSDYENKKCHRSNFFLSQKLKSS